MIGLSTRMPPRSATRWRAVGSHMSCQALFTTVGRAPHAAWQLRFQDSTCRSSRQLPRRNRQTVCRQFGLWPSRCQTNRRGLEPDRPLAARFPLFHRQSTAVPHSTLLARKPMSPAARVVCAVVFTLSSAGAALAQAAAESPSHSQPAAGVSYQSTLEDYRRFTEEKLTSWQEANDTVGRIGGWRTYAREAQQPADSPPAAPRAPAGTDTKPAPRGPRAGHGHH